MNPSVLQSRRHLLAALAAGLLLAGCADDAPLAPHPGTVPAQFTLGECGELAAPAGTRLAFHAYAQGVQIYQWNGTGWSFVGPDATLYADAAGHGVVGTHYSGPTWESKSGSKVVATLDQRCTADPASIPWLSLVAVSTSRPGIFNGVVFIQRLNTTGGNAPASAGSVTGEVARVAYTAEYFFYAAQ